MAQVGFEVFSLLRQNEYRLLTECAPASMVYINHLGPNDEAVTRRLLVRDLHE